MLNPQQIQTLFELLQRQLVFFAGKTLGPDFLTDADKIILKQYNIDPTKVYSPTADLVTSNFVLGILSQALGDAKVQQLSYHELTKYLVSGQHVPLNAREKATINSVKQQSLSDIRGSLGRIFIDVNRVVRGEHATARANQEEFLQEQIVEGLSARKSRQEIARELNRLTGDWKRDFRKSVAYVSHTALNEGRAALIERRYEGQPKEAKVWFQVQPDSCPKCAELYLTAGPGSEPKVFPLRELQANGTNIGRKQADWKATLGPIHVFCRCVCHEYVPGQVWQRGRFGWPDGLRTPVSLRPKVKITLNGVEHLV